MANKNNIAEFNKILTKHPDANLAWPQSQEEVDGLCDLVQSRYPHCPRIWAFVDGVKIKMDKPGNSGVQGLWYSKYKKMHCTSNVLLFRSDGLIAQCTNGGMGRANDSTLMYSPRMYCKIDQVYNNFGAKVAADSAFVYRSHCPSIVKSSETADTLRSCATLEEAQHVTSARQSVEWGMTDLKRGCPRLRQRLKFEDRGDRYLIMSLAVRMHNYRVNRIGLSQVYTTYGGYWDIDTYHIFQQMLDDRN